MANRLTKFTTMESTKQIKIEIRNRWTGSVVFEYTKEGNTITETVLEAIRRGADLCDAKGCYLSCPTEGSFIGWKKSLWAYRKITNSGRCAAQFGNGTQMPL